MLNSWNKDKWEEYGRCHANNDNCWAYFMTMSIFHIGVLFQVSTSENLVQCSERSLFFNMWKFSFPNRGPVSTCENLICHYWEMKMQKEIFCYTADRKSPPFYLDGLDMFVLWAREILAVVFHFDRLVFFLFAGFYCQPQF